MGLRFGENSNSADATNAIQKALKLKLLSQEGSLSESEKYDGDGMFRMDYPKLYDVDNTLVARGCG